MLRVVRWWALAGVLVPVGIEAVSYLQGGVFRWSTRPDDSARREPWPPGPAPGARIGGAIIRVDECQGEVPVEEKVTITKIVASEESAKREVDRLMRLNRDKGCRYFWQTTRMERPGPWETGSRPRTLRREGSVPAPSAGTSRRA